MPRTTHSTRTGRLITAASLAAALLATVLSGCQAGGDDASASASASTPATASPIDPAEAAKQERIADAIQRYREFLEIGDEHMRAGTNPFEELLNNGYLGNDKIQALEMSYWEQVSAQGLRLVGDSEGIVSIEALAYEGDPLVEDITGHRVQLEACIDNGGTDVVKPDGSSALQPGVSQRGVMEVVMQGQPSGLWSVVEYTPTNRAC